MSDDDAERPPIKAPATNRKREGVRAIAEAAASLDPFGVGGALTRIYQTTHPPKSETDREVWQEAISERTNENTGRLDQHEELICPKEIIEGAAALLAKKLILDCPNGMGMKYYEPKDVSEFLPDCDKDAIDDAAHELEILGLLSIRHHLGGDWHATLTDFAYEQLDSQFMGWNTADDAISIAKLMLEHKTGHAPKLEELSGWTRRRFNPAFRLIISLFPKGRVRQVIQPDYPSLGVIMDSEDRVRLRRFIENK